MPQKQAINTISKEFFQASLVTYLLLTLAETLRAGFVSNFFNMNYLLVVVLATGVGMVLTEQPEHIKSIRRETSRHLIHLAVKSAHLAKRAHQVDLQKLATTDVIHASATAATQAHRRTAALASQAVHHGRHVVTRRHQPVMDITAPPHPHHTTIAHAVASTIAQDTPPATNHILPIHDRARNRRYRLVQ